MTLITMAGESSSRVNDEDVASSSVCASSSSSPCCGSLEEESEVPAPIETKTMVEDQLVAMLRYQDVYTPATCASCSSIGIGNGIGSSSPTIGSDGSQSPRGVSSFPFPSDKKQPRQEVLGGGDSKQCQQQPPPPTRQARQQREQQQQLPIPHDEWRSKICEWSYRVVDHFRYDREVVSVAMNYFDRFLVLKSVAASSDSGGDGEGEGVDSRTYQLAAMTALYLSVKLHAEQQVYDEYDDPHHQDGLAAPHEHDHPITPRRGAGGDGHDHHAAGGVGHPHNPQQEHQEQHRRRSSAMTAPLFPPPRRKLKLLSFVELSRGQFSALDITDMERSMLTTLQWRVNPPTPMVFVSHLLRTMPSFVVVSTSSPPSTSSSARSLERRRDLVLHVLHELSRYLTELSICLPDVSAVHPPGTIAYAAILISLDLMSRRSLPPSVRSTYFDTLHGLSGGTLDPDASDVIHLRNRMGESFVPEMLADSSSAGSGHPIAIAREAGLLDERVDRHANCQDHHHDMYPEQHQQGEGFATPTTTPPASDVDDEGYVSCEGEVWADHEDEGGQDYEHYDVYDHPHHPDRHHHEGDLIDPSRSMRKHHRAVSGNKQSKANKSKTVPDHNKDGTSSTNTKHGNTKSSDKPNKQHRGHVRHGSHSSWLSSDGEESPVSVVRHHPTTAGAKGGKGGKSKNKASSSSSKSNPPIPTQGRVYQL